MRTAKTGSSGLAAAKHLLQALTAQAEALSGARLRAAFAERVVDHPTLELLDRLVERRARARRLPGLPDAIGQGLGADRPAVVGERDGAQAAERLGRDRRHRAPSALAIET